MLKHLPQVWQEKGGPAQDAGNTGAMDPAGAEARLDLP